MIYLDWNNRKLGHYRIEVCPNIWSESKKHLCLLTNKRGASSWSQTVWFSKDKCIFNPKGFLTLPVWYYDLVFKDEIHKPEILNHQ